MRNKILFTALIAMMLVSFAGFAAAASYSASWQNSTNDLFQGQNKVVAFNVTNDGSTSVPTNFFLDLSSLGLTNFNQNVTMAVNSSYTGYVTITTTTDTNVGKHTLKLVVTSLNASDTGSLSSPQDFNVLFPYCDNINNMTKKPIRLDEIKDQSKIEDKDYKPLDSISLEVRIDNLDQDDSQTAIAEMTLVSGNSEDNADAKMKLKLKSDKSGTAKLNITIPEDVKEGLHYLYVRVYNDDDSDNCEQKVLTINVKRSSNEVIPTELDFPNTATCGSTITFSGRTANIGKNDEDKVKVVLKGFGQTFDDVFDSVDSGDFSPTFSFDMHVPENSTGNNKLILTTYYSYNSDDEVYDDADTSDYVITTTCDFKKVEFATESSTALVGTTSQVRVLLSNPSPSPVTYSLSASADWASISSVTPSSLTLQGNGAQYVLVGLNPNADATVGIHTLNFKASHDGTAEAVNVPVNLQNSPSSLSVLSKINSQFKSNPVWFTLNAGLVLAIIVVIVLLVSGRKA